MPPVSPWQRALLTTGFLSATLAPAAAGDWSLGGSLTQEFSASTESEQDDSGGSGIFPRSTTRLGLDLVHQSPTSTLSLSGSSALVLAEDVEAEDLGYLTPGLGARLFLEGKRTSLNASLSGRLRSTGFSDTLGLVDGDPGPDPDPGDEPDDGGPEFDIVSGNATELRLSGELGLTHEIDPLNRVSLRTRAGRTDFFGGGTELVPNSSLSLTGGWSRDLTPRLGGNLSLGLGWFEAENEERTESFTLDARIGATYTVSPSLTFSGSIGGALIDTTETDFTLPVPMRRSDLAGSFIGDLRLDYRTDLSRIQLRLSQSVEPSSFGALQNTTALSLGLSRELTPYSRIGLSTGLQLQSEAGTSSFTSTNGGDAGTSLLIAPFYAYDLGPETSLRLGYAFEIDTQSTDGEDGSHAIFLTLTRRFSLLN